MIKAFIITVAVFIIICSCLIGLCVAFNKKRIFHKAESKKWHESYLNMVNLHNKNMEVIAKYENKENNIKPTADSYNDIVSNWNGSKSETKDTK